MIRVLISGPISKSGGVSTHTKNLIYELKRDKNHIVFYNFIHPSIRNGLLFNIDKIYRRTLGLGYFVFKTKDEFDIIHIQSSGGLGSFISAISGVLIAKIFQKPIIITFHYSKTEYFLNKYGLIFRFVLKNADQLILISKAQMNLINNKFPKYKNKLSYIPNGYNKSIFYPRDSIICRRKLNIDPHKKVIFNISNLIKNKGHTCLISAIKKVIEKYPNVICYIAGKGDQENKLKNQIIASGLENNVQLIGWIPDEQIPIWMNSCDIFVLPSFNEGNPIVMFECLACGKPFIGNKVGGIPEIINSNIGLLSESGNIIDLSEKIIQSFEVHWDHEKIYNYAKQFSWEIIAKDTKKLYSDLLKNPEYAQSY